MINEIAGHLWWESMDNDDYEVYLQAGESVYRCSPFEDAWRKVDASPNPKHFEFAEPLGMVISRCLSSPDGCRYVLFDRDGMAIRVFNPPPPPGMITILSHSASFVYSHQYQEFLASTHDMWETPIIDA